MKIKKVFFLLAFMCGLSAYTYGQVITGEVIDKSTNQAIIGANVTVTGTAVGTLTDVNGKFSLTLPSGSNQIQVSFMGYVRQTVNVTSGGKYRILLEPDIAVLNEVVVVGYGAQKKANLTGAVSTVDVGKTLEARPITDVGRALQGTTAGLVVTTSSGAIGDAPSIKIRGMVSTISGNSGNPLVLVDNVEVPDLTYVNPDDIESISVLKDASTTAIYGARAAFGAILITTKKGARDGDVKITYSNNFAWATPTKVPEHTRADLNLQYSYDQLNALKTTPTYEYGQVGYWYNPDVIAKVKDWIDTYGDGSQLGREMVEGRDFDYRTAGGAYFYRPWDIYNEYYKEWTPQQNQSISVSGGNEKTQYNLSASSLNQKGVEKLFDDFFKRLSTSGSFSTDVKKWLTVRGRYMYSKTSEETPFLYAAATYDPMYYLYRWHQVYPYGTYNGDEFRGGINDLKSARPGEDDSYYSRYTLGTTLNVVKGLTIDFDYTFAQTFATQHQVGGYVKGIDFWNRTGSTTPASDTFEEVTKIYSSSSYDYAQYTSSKNLRNTFNAYATYEKALGNHSIKLMAGSNIEDAETVYLSAKRNGVYDFNRGEVNLAGGDQSATSNHSWWSVTGFFGRINYSLNDKYLIELDGRYDGSSKFSEDTRWAFFPSGSAAWRVSQEPWMQPLKPIISTFKLRGSYGMVGNQDVPLNAYISTLGVLNPSASGNYWLINNNFVPFIEHKTATPAPALVDPTLTWEKVTTLDFAADARFLNDKLGLTVEWYQRTTSDMLSPGLTIPSTVGANAPKRNFGELTTKGVELAIDYGYTFSNGLHLTVSGQYTDFKTVVSKYPSANDPQNSVTYYEGKTLGEIWGYKTEGLFQNDDFVWSNDAISQVEWTGGQLKNAMKEGVPNQYILESGLFKYGPGDVRFKDLNGDGVINYGSNTVGDPGDRTVIGNTNPRFQYGFRLGADWKGIDVATFFQGVGKRSIWATGNMVLPGYYGAEANFSHTLDYWTPDNTDAFYPRPMEYSQTAKWNYVVNDRYLLNVGYLRLKNITVGYSLPSKWVDKVNITKLRVYFIGENLFEFDKMGDVPIDPEIDWTTNTSNDSRSFGRSYPYRRTLSFGIQLEL
jgi:TonB-linked SusC/RagA family outer membrane protein